MPQTILIVMERSGSWAVALRRWLKDSTVRVIETRSLEEFWQRLVEYPAALAAWELNDTNIRAIVGALVRSQREFPRAAAVVLAERSLAACAELMREAGAIHFVDSPRAISVVAEMARRLASRPTDIASGRQHLADENDDLLAAIWSNLPWSDTV
jgi:hypothetical protein